MKMSQEELLNYIETGTLQEGFTKADAFEAMKEKFELEFGENGETPNKEAYDRFMFVTDIIGTAFGVLPKDNKLN